MSDKPGYKVGFSKQLRNVFYEDSQGKLHFVFDPLPAPTHIIIFLGLKPLSEHFEAIDLSKLTQEELARINLARERVKQFFVSRGELVEDDKNPYWNKLSGAESLLG